MSKKKTEPAKTKKAKAKKRRPTEAELLTEAEELLAKIEAKEQEAMRASLRMGEIKEEYKEAKGAYQTLVLDLRKLCRVRKESHPLFDQPKNAETKADADAPVDVNEEMNKWRAKPINEVIADSALANKLEEQNHIHDLGELLDFFKQHRDFWNQNLKGIGSAGADKIQEFMRQFREANPEFVGAELVLESAAV